MMRIGRIIGFDRVFGDFKKVVLGNIQEIGVSLQIKENNVIYQMFLFSFRMIVQRRERGELMYKLVGGSCFLKKGNE